MTAALTATVIVLAAGVLVLLQLIVGIRAVAIRRKRLNGQLRPAAELTIADYLAGTSTVPEPASPEERKVLLAVALEALADLRGGERARLVSLLEKLGFVSDAEKALRSRSRVARQRAAETLAAIATPATVYALTLGLSDRDVLVRTSCARTLAEIGGADVLRQVAACAMNDMEHAPGAGAAIVLALGSAHPDALGVLLGPGAPMRVRAIATTVAGELRLVEHAPLLRANLNDSDDIAARAARGLGRIGDGEAIRPLVELAADAARGPQARSAAISALGWIGAPEALGVVAAQLEEQDWLIIAAATGALARLGESGRAALRSAAGSPRKDVSALAAAALQP